MSYFISERARQQLFFLVSAGVIALVVTGPRVWASWQGPISLPLTRHVEGQTITSLSSPAVDVTVDPEFAYEGAVRVTLSGNADAELHLFAKLRADGVAQAFYWIQFEHFLPSNSRRYNAGSPTTIDVGGFQFYYDTLGYADFQGIQSSQPGSDGAAAVVILAQRRHVFPHHVARVRMFHFPDADRRSELMIIYGEALDASASVPEGLPRFPLDAASADAIVERMQHGLIIRRR